MRQGVKAFLLLAVVGLILGLSSDSMLAQPQSSTAPVTDEAARSDINGDRVVDLLDLVCLCRNFGKTVEPTDCEGKVVLLQVEVDELEATVQDLETEKDQLAAEIDELRTFWMPSGDAVYITKTGTKYHRGGCQYVAGKICKIPIDKGLAISCGFEPCSVCNP